MEVSVVCEALSTRCLPSLLYLRILEGGWRGDLEPKSLGGWVGMAQVAGWPGLPAGQASLEGASGAFVLPC